MGSERTVDRPGPTQDADTVAPDNCNHCFHAIAQKLVNPPITVKRCCWCGEHSEWQEAVRHHGPFLYGEGLRVDPPPVPLVADPKLVTHLIGSGTPVPPPYDEPLNFGGGIESVQHNDGFGSGGEADPPA